MPAGDTTALMRTREELLALFADTDPPPTYTRGFDEWNRYKRRMRDIILSCYAKMNDPTYPGPGPKGDRGDAGPKGDSGAAGQQGQAGTPGLKGDTGDRGPAGETGPRGETGVAGTPFNLGTPTFGTSVPTVAAGTPFQPRPAGPCAVSLLVNVGGLVALTATVRVYLSATQTGSYSLAAQLTATQAVLPAGSTPTVYVPAGWWVRVDTATAGLLSSVTLTRTTYPLS